MHLQVVWGWLVWTWIGIETLLAVITRTRRGGGSITDRGSMLVIWGAIFASMFASGWLQYAAPASIRFHARWLLPFSVLLLLAGLAIRLTAILSLGRAFSVNVAIRDNQKLKQNGLYRFVRHPSYLGALIMFLAVGVQAQNWASLTAAVVPTTLAFLYRIHVEEAVLHQAFGRQYAAYCNQSKRLVPGLY
jgi:protein-S-isoprenylcysteine O-methyltransferase Ste14